MSVSTVEEFQAWKRQTEESTRVVQAAVEALNRGDAAGFLGSFSDDLVFEMPGTTPVSGTTRGIQEFIALATKVADLTSVMITLKVTFFLAAGEWVVVRADGHGVTKAGRDYDNHYCQLWRVRNGKICEFVEYNDTQLIMDVLCV
jgi:uncharacterized protein